MVHAISKVKQLWIPILLVAALLTASGVVWSQQGNGGGGSTAYTDINPAYNDVLLIPPEAGAGNVLITHMIEMDPSTSMVVMGPTGGEVATVVLTSLIPADGNEALTGPNYGDLTGVVQITAKVYTPYTYGVVTTWPTAPADLPIIFYSDITVHPEKTVTFQVPIASYNPATPPGTLVMYKAEFVVSTGP